MTRRSSGIARVLVTLALTAALVSVAQPTSADQITDHISHDQQQRAKALAEIAALKAQIAAAQDQEAALTAIIGQINTQIASTQAQVAAAQTHLALIGVQLSAAQAQLAQAQRQLADEKHQLSTELVVIYELANQSTPVSNLLSSGNFNQFWTDVIDSQRISDRELQTVDQIHLQQQTIQTDVDQIGAEQQQQQAALAQLFSTEQSLNDQRAERQTAVDYLARLQAQDQQQAQQWEAAAQAISAQIAQLQIEEQQALAAGGGNGHFVWPDTGPISQGFGCTPYSFEPYDPNCPQRHFHNGLDIAGACGNHIYAADAGIAHIEPYMSYGYGNYIIIVHGNGWLTLYGHMSGFAIGGTQTVSRGQLIGYEGSTGNSTGCHLHFGVQLNNQWVNPIAYLP